MFRLPEQGQIVCLDKDMISSIECFDEETSHKFIGKLFT